MDDSFPLAAHLGRVAFAGLVQLVQTGGGVLLQEGPAEALQRGADRCHLLHDLLAVALCVQHLLDAVDLAFDLAQPLDQDFFGLSFDDLELLFLGLDLRLVGLIPFCLKNLEFLLKLNPGQGEPVC